MIDLIITLFFGSWILLFVLMGMLKADYDGTTKEYIKDIWKNFLNWIKFRNLK